MQLSYCVARCGHCLRINQIANPLSLAEVYLTVSQSAKSEFPWTSEPRVKPECKIDDLSQDYRRTMTTQLYNILPSKGVWSLEVTQQDLIDDAACFRIFNALQHYSSSLRGKILLSNKCPGDGN